MNHLDHEMRIAKEYARIRRERVKREDVAAHSNGSEEYVDACIGCQAADCNDKDIHCALVAKHQKRADATSASRIIASDKYKRLLREELDATGTLPFSEQYSYIDIANPQSLSAEKPLEQTQLTLC